MIAGCRCLLPHQGSARRDERRQTRLRRLHVVATGPVRALRHVDGFRPVAGSFHHALISGTSASGTAACAARRSSGS